MADETIVSEAVEAPVEASVSESPVETTETTESESPVEQVEGESEGTEPVEGEVEGEASAPLPYAKVKGLIESLKKTDPQLAKEVKNLYFAQQAIAQAAPGGLPQIKEALATVEELGGAEGVQGIKAQQAEWAEIDQKFADGDASVLDLFAKENPEGYAKLADGYLSKLASTDRDTYNRVTSGIFAATLDSWQFTPIVDALIQNMSQVVDENQRPLLSREVAALKELQGKYNGIKELSTKQPTKEVDTEKQKIAAERAEVAAERAKIAGEYVARETDTYAKAKYDTLIPAEARVQGLNLDLMKKSDAYETFINEIDGEVAKLIIGSGKAQQVQALLAAGKRQDAVKTSNNLFDQVVQKAVKQVSEKWARRFNPKGPVVKGGTKAAAPGTGLTPAGVKKLTAAPDMKLVDKSSPDWKDQFMWGKAKLTTGQRVAWD